MLKLLHWRKCQNIVLQLCYFIPKMISFVYWFNSYSILYLFHFNNVELVPQWAYKIWLVVCHSPTKILSSLCQNNLSTQSKHSSLIKNLEWQIARLHCLVIQLTRIYLLSTKTGHCSLPVSALQTRSALSCICSGKILFPYIPMLAESLSCSLYYFPSWSCWHLLVVEISIITDIGEDLEDEVAISGNITLCLVYPLSETSVCGGRTN